jgi:nucleotide-binding universal stress UspA family protein
MELAASVAASIRGEVVALAVVEVPEVTSYADASAFTGAPRRLLEQAESIALRFGVPCSSLLRIGRSARTEIVATAREHGCDLILLGYKKDEDPLENSLIHHVITEQPCDVAILKTRGQSIAEIRRVLLPIAGREVHDRLKVRLVHGVVRGFPQRESAAPEIAFLSVVPGGAAALETKRAKQVLERTAGTYGLQGATRLVVAAEDPGQAIEAQVEDGDLLVLGLRAEPALRRFFFGSLAQRVAGGVSGPVVLTKARPPRRKRVFGSH